MIPIPPWVKPFIGIPFLALGRDWTGCDCFGLLRLVYREQFGIELPSYTEDYADTLDRQELARLIAGQIQPWRPVPFAHCGDAVLFRIAGDECHVGLVVAPPVFLHAQEGKDTCLERWDAAGWRRRIVGIYRHEAMA
jgi:cell wall-associated NlpC family hydrolase